MSSSIIGDCKDCRYCEKNNSLLYPVRDPCETGVWQIYYSHRCYEYRPKLKLVFLKWLNGVFQKWTNLVKRQRT